MSGDELARSVMARCDTLGGFSEEPERLTRRFATAPMREVNARVAAWMRAAGMDVRQDAVGNIIGRYEGQSADAPTLLLGSHLDTVRDAGKYDGPLGVLTALALVERLHAHGERLPLALEVYGFADEEGLRFHTAYLGSAVVAGAFAPATLTLADADGTSVEAALRAFGGDPTALQASTRGRADLAGYVEVHIEQGPVLEAQGVPVGVVMGIQGQSRLQVTLTGVAGHAGTVPIRLRHDALCAAADLILAVESLAFETDGLVATVGQIAAYPGASNVIPGEATLSLDIRHHEDGVRGRAIETLHRRAAQIAEKRGVDLLWQSLQDNPAVRCDGRLSGLLSRSIEACGQPVIALPSGAGHDGVMMSRLAPIAMLFVRCAGGISHNPAESVREDDVAVALDVLERFVRQLAEQRGGA
jgi:allantoate deiminase